MTARIWKKNCLDMFPENSKRPRWRHREWKAVPRPSCCNRESAIADRRTKPSPALLDLRHPVKFISNLLWNKSVLTAVRQYRQPKRDSFRDSQPVKVVQQRRHVVEFPGFLRRTSPLTGTSMTVARIRVCLSKERREVRHGESFDRYLGNG